MHTALAHKSKLAAGSPGCAAWSVKQTKPSPWEGAEVMFCPSLAFTPWLVWGLCSLAELLKQTPCAWGTAAQGAPSCSPSHVEYHRAGRRWHAGCSAEWHPNTGCASRYVLLTGYVQGLLLGGCQKYLFNRKEKPYEKRWSRAVFGRVSRGTFQRALKIKSWSLATTLCVSVPHLCSSGSSSCRTDPPCPLLLVLPTYVFSCWESTASLGFLVNHGLTFLPSSIW